MTLLRTHGIEVREYCPRIDKYLAVGLANRLPVVMKPAASAVLRAVSLGTRRSGIRASRQADLTWLDRELIPGVFSAEGRLGRPLAFDVDDAIWVHRDAKPEQLTRIASAAAVVIAGNEFIADWFRPHASRVEVIPTAVDTSRFSPAFRDAGVARLRIGWTGTNSNFGYLRSIEPALARFLETHDATLVIVADRPPHLGMIPARKWSFESWTAGGEVEAIRRFDIGLMPLFDDTWGRGKCGYKALQYMACGVPALVSPVGFNRTLVATGGAVGAENEEEWVTTLGELASDPARRRAIGILGRSAVEREYSLEVISKRLAEVFHSLVEGGRS